MSSAVISESPLFMAMRECAGETLWNAYNKLAVDKMRQVLCEIRIPASILCVSSESSLGAHYDRHQLMKALDMLFTMFDYTNCFVYSHLGGMTMVKQCNSMDSTLLYKNLDPLVNTESRDISALKWPLAAIKCWVTYPNRDLQQLFISLGYPATD